MGGAGQVGWERVMGDWKMKRALASRLSFSLFTLLSSPFTRDKASEEKREKREE
jgi:hypothetical protein